MTDDDGAKAAWDPGAWRWKYRRDLVNEAAREVTSGRVSAPTEWKVLCAIHQLDEAIEEMVAERKPPPCMTGGEDATDEYPTEEEFEAAMASFEEGRAQLEAEEAGNHPAA